MPRTADAHIAIAGVWDGSYDRYVPGEIHRFNAHVYDAYYRSPNVYRDSAHAHPSRNVFRSSRAYQNTLSYSNDARYVRTYVHDRGGIRDELDCGHGSNRWRPRRSDGVTFSRACGTIRPILASPVSWTDFYPAPYAYRAPYADPGVITRRNPRVELQMRDGTFRDPRTIEMVLLTPPREPTQTPVMEQMTLPDGRVKTLISSVPKQQPQSVNASDRVASTATAAPQQ